MNQVKRSHILYTDAMELREHLNLKITAIVGLVSLGIAIIAFSQPVVTSLETEMRHIDSFHHALELEVIGNSAMLAEVDQEYKKDAKISVVPTLSSTAYEAILNAGALDNYNDDTRSDLVNLYMQINRLEHIYSSSQDAHSIALSARITLTYIDDYRRDFGKSNILELENNHYKLWLAIGSAFAIIGASWLMFEYFSPQIISILRFFSKLAKLFDRKRK